ncbi:hypothetical protein B0T10DRAFT_453736 [Thelonectria olida]|uniref:Uncharacterized protein n=1 Tax=Thelonectria olida TaxID=1576542 RepID=A0A9P8WI41_9HYPO|nr:hypothetical protein B0T10DRAFT_453736 [Thelonectria olida]
MGKGASSNHHRHHTPIQSTNPINRVPPSFNSQPRLFSVSVDRKLQPSPPPLAFHLLHSHLGTGLPRTSHELIELTPLPFYSPNPIPSSSHLPSLPSIPRQLQSPALRQTKKVIIAGIVKSSTPFAAPHSAPPSQLSAQPPKTKRFQKTPKESSLVESHSSPTTWARNRPGASRSPDSSLTRKVDWESLTPDKGVQEFKKSKSTNRRHPCDSALSFARFGIRLCRRFYPAVTTTHWPSRPIRINQPPN